MNVLQLDKGRKNQLISFIVVDGEGEGGYTDDKAGWCPFNKAMAWAQDLPWPNTASDKPGSGSTKNRSTVKISVTKPDGTQTAEYSLGEIFPNRFQSGIAHGPGNFCAPGSSLKEQTCELIGTTRAYPELYWIGELMETKCSLNTAGTESFTDGTGKGRKTPEASAPWGTPSQGCYNTL